MHIQCICVIFVFVFVVYLYCSGWLSGTNWAKTEAFLQLCSFSTVDKGNYTEDDDDAFDDDDDCDDNTNQRLSALKVCTIQATWYGTVIRSYFIHRML